MGRTEPIQPEIRRIRRLLHETVRLAEHASLTGSLDKGSRFAIRQYNHIREHLQDIGAIPDDLFQDLDENEATFDELGIVCGMLESYLMDDEEVVDAGPTHSAKVVGMVGLKELEDLKEIGKVIRESLPEFLRKQSHGGVPDAIRIEIERSMEAAHAAREHAREAEQEARRTAREVEREAHWAEREAKRDENREEGEERHTGREEERSAQQERAREVAQVTTQIRDVGERLRRPDLENGQRAELLQNLDHLMTTLQHLAEALPPEG